ncbi:hypothetical protein PR202_ga17960 [Eleusine coracana subsp. coracana]|uniref:RING-type domain-containing protein n=1 Tax=Eleusine coracana subsp. coracana TaxID=191504 RepID=A0AAV5CRH3_ELECO|nr:hypothetical protein PR202_ga17960 [Eleusine coracana subsp. coracana]
MAIMAGMLPGVECARRRRLRQGGDAAAGGGTRRPSFCLYAAGHGGHHAGAGNPPAKQRSGVMEMIHKWTVDSNAREAKERLDQKLRSKREATASQHGEHKAEQSPRRGELDEVVVVGAGSAARGVYSKQGVMRRLMRWGRPRWDAAEQAECAVCLDEFRAGDVLAHLPCGHRFHWACALPWLQGTSRCPFCRAAVDAHGHAAAS